MVCQTKIVKSWQTTREKLGARGNGHLRQGSQTWLEESGTMPDRDTRPMAAFPDFAFVLHTIVVYDFRQMKNESYSYLSQKPKYHRMLFCRLYLGNPGIKKGSRVIHEKIPGQISPL
jgi:hypothetical protein